VHDGAVYLHRGESYLVDELDLAAGVAVVHRADPDWRTDARSTADVAVARVLSRRDHGPVRVSFGEVTVTSRVVAYQRKAPDGAVLETVQLDLPEQTLPTRGVWYDIDDAALDAAGIPPARIPGALHAAEHAAIGLLPLFAICDRWDVGGMSTALHPYTGRPTVFVHDGHPGGAGFAERGHAVLGRWLAATRAAIRDCECRAGCPSCVQSPKCGNGNSPLDKAGAVVVLDLVLDALSSSEGPRSSEGPGGSGGADHRRPATSGAGPADGGRGAVEPVPGWASGDAPAPPQSGERALPDRPGPVADVHQ
jgi:DEAD/DEAH box helicase domain-containing protein